MSKSILISKNDGTDFSESVTKIRTDELGASMTDWVPEAEVQPSSLTVTANGTYSASTAGKYCYDMVSVSVAGSVVTGKGNDGKEKAVTVDGDGNLQYETLPVSIAVTTPPDTLQYSDGDTIDFTGIVVHAYDSDGDDMGEVAYNELVFPVTVAEYTGNPQDVPVDWSRSVDGAVLETSFQIRVTA